MLNASDKIEPILRRVYDEVARACADLSIDYVVVGAAARDLVLHHVYGAPVTRATSDIDFGPKVESWESFHRLRNALIARGYREAGSLHRLFSPGGTQVDIVPFGKVADSASNVAWPPDGEIVMNVLGFREAHAHSDVIRLQENPRIDIRVATPIGMALLKIIAWTDRALDLRVKDAKDLRHLLGNYSKIPEVFDTIYADPELGTRHQWDVDLMSAELLRASRGLVRPRIGIEHELALGPLQRRESAREAAAVAKRETAHRGQEPDGATGGAACRRALRVVGQCSGSRAQARIAMQFTEVLEPEPAQPPVTVALPKFLALTARNSRCRSRGARVQSRHRWTCT